jgi:hypothetical protein
VRKSLHWLGLGCFAIAIVNGCGGGSGANIPQGDDAGDGSAVDVTTDTGSGNDATQTDVGTDGNDASTGDDSNVVDAGLDISFPDTLTMPETGIIDAGDDGDGGMIVDGGCMPNGILCNGNIAEDCNNGVLTVTDCTKLNPPQTCAVGYGCVVCQPGTGSCNGNVGTQCKGDGSGYVTNTCNPVLGETCSNGACLGDCAQLGTQSNIGCEFYAVTLSNSQLSQGTFYFSVSLSNTSGSKKASITITGPANFSTTDTIPPASLHEYKLPWVNQLSGGGGSPPATTMATGGAYHITSNEPLTAYQFNARDYVIGGIFSYTNDASIMLPVNALTGNYYVATQGTWNYSGFSFPGEVGVIATQNNTKVTYSAPAGQTIQAGAGLGTSGGTVTLNAGDVLEVMSTLGGSGYTNDQSGATITATNPVEVFGGNDCSFVNYDVWCCDHMEEVNFPIETLRNDYMVTLPWNDNGTPQQYVKVVATKNGTSLTYDPPQAGAAASLNAGQTTFFHTTQHFHVTSNNPVFVGQYMMSEQNFTPNDTAGDPSLSLAVATSQFRDNYQFVAPANYQQNWVNVIAPSGASITVDGVVVPANTYTPIGNSGYGVAKVSLCANNSCQNNGVHLASGNKQFGIEVYGYGSYTSYMYPGGLNLQRQ